MALSPEERQILEYGKANGKSAIEVKAAISKYRATNPTQPVAAPQTAPEKPSIASRVTDFLGLGGATQTFGNAIARTKIGAALTGTDYAANQEYVEAPTGKQLLGATAQTAATAGSFAIGGPASLLGKVAVGAGLGYAYDVGQDLVDKKSALETATPGMATALGAGAPVVAKGSQALLGAVKPAATGAVNAVANALPESQVVQAAKQTTSEIAERVPRFVGRVSEEVAEQAAKAQRIKTATPVVANAMKVDLPEKFINTVGQADDATKAAYKQVLDIADETPKTIGVKKNPTIVGGELASKQYDAIEKQRKAIGTAIGEATKQLSKTQKVNMRPAYSQLDSLLEEQGITTLIDEKGVRLDFSRSKLAPKQREVVKNLYQLAVEAGSDVSPFDIHRKDQLFSALQREARTDQVADIIIDLPDGGKTDLFRAFRDVYSNQLDDLSPDIKKLNRQYRNIATLVDDIENSIFKTPNFEITKSTDQAEFAKVNLRRIFGEAQSSPVYEAIADEMDAIARQLGYADAKPKDVAAFAQELRELYPEITPRTGFAGGIRAGVMDVAERVLSAGKANPDDQRKALRALLEATEQSAKAQ